MITKNLQQFYSSLPLQGPLLGIDFGTKKIGLAISSSNRNIAVPYIIITNDDKLLFNINQLIEEKNICGIVIGLPVNMDGSSGEQAEKIIKFAEKLLYLNLPIFLQDERRTSKASQALLSNMGYDRKKRDEIDDKYAACIILEAAIESFKNMIPDPDSN